MPLVAIAVLIAIIVLMAGAWLAFASIGLLVKLALAGLIGALADMAVPGRLPYGWLGAVLAGILGGWVGSLILGGLGPGIFGIELIPTFVGAVLVVGGYELAARTRSRD